jgi:hypothetical protein
MIGSGVKAMLKCWLRILEDVMLVLLTGRGGFFKYAVEMGSGIMIYSHLEMIGSDI